VTTSIDAARLNVGRAVAASARARRFQRDDSAALMAVDREVTAAKIEFAVAKALADAPPLTPEQAQRIHDLLVAPQQCLASKAAS